MNEEDAMHIGNSISEERERELPLLIHEEMRSPCGSHFPACQPHGIHVLRIGVVRLDFMPVHIRVRHLGVILHVSAIPKCHIDLIEVLLLLLLLPGGKRIDRLRLVLIIVLCILIIISKRTTFNEEHIPMCIVRVIDTGRHDAQLRNLSLLSLPFKIRGPNILIGCRRI